MDQRITLVSVSCALVALVSCGGVAGDNQSGRGGGGFGGSDPTGMDAGGTEAIAGSAGADPERTADAGAAGSAGSLSSAGSAGDAGSGGVSVACSFSAPPAASTPVDASPLEETAEGGALVVLDDLVGRYLRGDVLVYRGTANAHDNAGVIGEAAQSPNFSDETLPDGPVLAGLELRPASPDDYSPPKQNVSGDAAILTLVSALAHKHLILSQALAQQSVTEATQLTNETSSNLLRGLVTACTSCAPKFWSQPGAIVLEDLMTSGVYSVLPPSGPAVDVTLHTFVSAQLTLAAPCSLTYDDLVVLNGERNMAIFALEGSQMVWHYMGTIEPSHSWADGCWFGQPYTLDAFIDPSDLSHYGVRNFKLGTPVRECIAV